MRVVTHEYANIIQRFKETPSFRFENMRMSTKMITSGRQTIIGPVINRIYVDSLEFPKEIDKTHLCLFLVDVPYYRDFCRMYQSRFGDIPTSFDPLLHDDIVRWTMKTFGLAWGKAEKLIEYFRYNMIKMLYNPDAVSTFISGRTKDSVFQSYTYETIYKFLIGDVTIDRDDYLKALSKYRLSRTAIIKWLLKRLSKEVETIETVRLQLWLQGKRDSDLLIFAREVAL